LYNTTFHPLTNHEPIASVNSFIDKEIMKNWSDRIAVKDKINIFKSQEFFHYFNYCRMIYKASKPI